MLKYENGDDYNINEFNDYYVKYMIKRKFKIPYTPKKNGFYERKNMTI